MAVIKKVSPRGITSKAPEKEDVSGTEKKAIPAKEEKNTREDNLADKKAGSSSINSLDYNRPKKVCNFCKSKSTPRYSDAAALRKYMNDRGRISSRIRTGNCAKHQRCIAREIKRARHLALLPFVIKV